MDLAKEIPESFGISISFSGESDKNQDGTDLARCTELYSADLVQHPASNPTGLFSAKNSCIAVDSKIKDMQTKTDTDVTEGTDAPTRAKQASLENFESFNARLEALEAFMTKYEAKTTEDEKTAMEDTKKTEDEKTTMGEQDKEETKMGDYTKDGEKMGAFPFNSNSPEYKKKEKATKTKDDLSAVLTAIQLELGKIASAPIASGTQVEVKAPTSFADLVHFEMKQNNISKGESLRLCVGKYNDQYVKELNAGGMKTIS